jgi:nucleotide-binding universal stress UspA family protein
MARAGGFRSLLIGVDGSSGSRRAVSFVGRLTPPRGGRALVVRVVDPVYLPSIALLPASTRATLTAQAAAMQAARVRTARRDVDTAVARLEKSGWRARGEVRVGVPLVELLAMARKARSDLLVLGARGIGRVEKFLLGSVADACTKRSPISVVIVK